MRDRQATGRPGKWRRLAAAVAVSAGLAVAAPSAAHAGNGFFTSQDLTASGAPVGASGKTTGWYTPWDRVRHVAYFNTSNVITIASLAPGASTWSSATAPNVSPVGLVLTGYAYAWDRSSHVIYLGSDNHVHELWYTQDSPVWHDADLTAVTGAPSGLWPTTGYEQGGAQHIVASTTSTHVLYHLVFTPGTGWQAQNLTTFTDGGPYTTLLPVGVSRGDGQTIAYLARDGFIHALSSTTGSGWSDVAIRQAVGANNVYAGLGIFFDAGGSRLAITYVGPVNPTPRHLHELTWTPSAGWSDSDVTAASGGPAFTGAGIGGGLSLASDGSDRIFTVDAANAIWEYVRVRGGRWFAWKDTGDGTVQANNDVTAFAAPDDAAGTSYTDYVVYLDGSGHPHVMDMTTPTS
ncbi:hypothetical protein [Dactylosporangium sp. CA-092794]|uniref:hypothetical protein n=1 Tax=Dactylosporangium sp. CA-092794 TaxID=3239929 RepID=UPI003D9340AC